ncbi:transposase [Photorhabdus temperata]|uniref:transposase n=1 Tax=Photorhabdus temperata TaxID=574560 RepID=UPI0021D48F4C|nr:transposase [Photorhabdus temperata]MCT8348176.1 transposase [Photorhabdus temperata]
MFISFQRGYVEYQAQAAGIQVKYVNPAYKSKTYSRCDCIGRRNKHRLEYPHHAFRGKPLPFRS